MSCLAGLRVQSFREASSPSCFLKAALTQRPRGALPPLQQEHLSGGGGGVGAIGSACHNCPPYPHPSGTLTWDPTVEVKFSEEGALVGKGFMLKTMQESSFRPHQGVENKIN